MAATNNKHTLDEPASADPANAMLAMLEQDTGRFKVQSIINDFVDKSAFTDKIVNITRDTLGHKDTYAVLEPQVQAQIDKTLQDNGLKQKKFWIPVVISIISAIAAIIAAIAAVK